ncbi:hypothetical protein [Phormidesmis priestleyi]|uniref:hypothetical protein n=1 Tax=Phormidesmis priestleyi TaxID=268141 RepID=UPI000A9C82FC|nr:hypothetical protein [Phormidesmis priestleyi]
MGTSYGLLGGVVLGTIFNNLALWIGIGVAIGLRSGLRSPEVEDRRLPFLSTVDTFRQDHHRPVEALSALQNQGMNTPPCPPILVIHLAD